MDTHQPADANPERRQRRDARENRQQILVAAKWLFAAQGIEATSMQEIARAAAVGQGTLYRHFADKGDLCLALLKEDLAAFRERVGAIVADTRAAPSPLARLEILIVEKIGLTEGHLPLLAAVQDAAAGSRRPFRGPFDTWVHERIVALLDQAIAQGEVAPLDVAFTADAIVAALVPQHYRYQRELGYSSERISAGMCHLFVERLRALPSRSQESRA
ncbi:MAG TPA: TetR/AcrR family transcriptional regulator [Roseiflexaceae bacterium]|nr:TetR/AcrR family transcriptional regulator [Roseiflexaceae bacterium]